MSDENPAAPEPIEEEQPAAGGSGDVVAVGEAVDVQKQSIEDMLAAQEDMAVEGPPVESAQCIHLVITNREEQAPVAEQRARLRSQARADGYSDEVIPAILDKLAPTPASQWAIARDESGALTDQNTDAVLVHAGHSITERELRRFGLTAQDIEEANR